MLADNQVYVTDLEMLTLVGRFDRKNDGRITYSEFVEYFSPKSWMRLINSPFDNFEYIRTIEF